MLLHMMNILTLKVYSIDQFLSLYMVCIIMYIYNAFLWYKIGK